MSSTVSTDAGTPPGEQAGRTPRAGRDLPAAIGIGVLLGGVVATTLFTQKRLFVGLTVVFLMLAVDEVSRALRGRGVSVAEIPLVVGGGAVLVAAYLRGTEALVIATMLLVVAGVLVGVVVEGVDKLAAVTAGIFVTCYVAFLGGFTILMVVPPDGPRRVAAFVATVACSDTGGYAAGVLFGKHPMAPTVSPKKSWEGFAGSVISCAVCAGLLFPLILHASWWQGVLFGLAVVVTATLGDLSESLIKRDLGIKDMGHILPGHGGIMDRLDSLIMTAPIAWAILTVFVPWPK
jgi:phosphatidate cytidylyltransferase